MAGDGVQQIASKQFFVVFFTDFTLIHQDGRRQKGQGQADFTVTRSML
jgi:hypothetical protein